MDEENEYPESPKWLRHVIETIDRLEAEKRKRIPESEDEEDL